tara:strand:+ start:979 stop:1533 length:555 start_codon:yes stop_codon:yes gene_type:complete
MQTFPSTDFVSVLPISNAPDYISEAQSLKTISVSTGAQRYEFDLETQIARMPTAKAHWMFLAARRQGAFQIQIPLFDQAEGLVTGVVKSNQAKPVGTSEITFVNYLPAIGDFFQCAGHSKVYGVERVNGNVATIFPPLFKAVGSNEVFTVNNLLFTVRRKGELLKLSNKRGTTGNTKFKVIEAF